MNVAHQQMTGQIVEDTNAQQQQTGTQQAHDHVPDCSFNGSAVLSDHNQTTGGNRIDLYKYIGCK